MKERKKMCDVKELYLTMIFFKIEYLFYFLKYFDIIILYILL